LLNARHAAAGIMKMLGGSNKESSTYLSSLSAGQMSIFGYEKI